VIWGQNYEKNHKGYISCVTKTLENDTIRHKTARNIPEIWKWLQLFLPLHRQKDKNWQQRLFATKLHYRFPTFAVDMRIT
jgi:hypothetical protein